MIKRRVPNKRSTFWYDVGAEPDNYYFRSGEKGKPTPLDWEGHDDYWIPLERNETVRVPNTLVKLLGKL